MGRFDRVKARVYVEALQISASDAQAAASAGISVDEAREWADRRREFAAECHAARSGIEYVRNLHDAAAEEDAWRINAYLAERSEQRIELARLRELTTD